jgi:hypothetical protein
MVVDGWFLARFIMKKIRTEIFEEHAVWPEKEYVKRYG